MLLSTLLFLACLLCGARLPPAAQSLYDSSPSRNAISWTNSSVACPLVEPRFVPGASFVHQSIVKQFASRLSQRLYALQPLRERRVPQEVRVSPANSAVDAGHVGDAAPTCAQQLRTRAAIARLMARWLVVQARQRYSTLAGSGSFVPLVASNRSVAGATDQHRGLGPALSSSPAWPPAAYFTSLTTAMSSRFASLCDSVARKPVLLAAAASVLLSGFGAMAPASWSPLLTRSLLQYNAGLSSGGWAASSNMRPLPSSVSTLSALSLLLAVTSPGYAVAGSGSVSSGGSAHVEGINRPFGSSGSVSSGGSAHVEGINRPFGSSGGGSGGGGGKAGAKAAAAGAGGSAAGGTSNHANAAPYVSPSFFTLPEGAQGQPFGASLLMPSSEQQQAVDGGDWKLNDRRALLKLVDTVAADAAASAAAGAATTGLGPLFDFDQRLLASLGLSALDIGYGSDGDGDLLLEEHATGFHETEAGLLLEDPAALVREELDRLYADGVDIDADPLLRLLDEFTRQGVAGLYDSDDPMLPSFSSSSVPPSRRPRAANTIDADAATRGGRGGSSLSPGAAAAPPVPVDHHLSTAMGTRDFIATLRALAEEVAARGDHSSTSGGAAAANSNGGAAGKGKRDHREVLASLPRLGEFQLPDAPPDTRSIDGTLSGSGRSTTVLPRRPPVIHADTSDDGADGSVRGGVKSRAAASRRARQSDAGGDAADDDAEAGASHDDDAASQAASAGGKGKKSKPVRAKKGKGDSTTGSTGATTGTALPSWSPLLLYVAAAAGVAGVVLYIVAGARPGLAHSITSSTFKGGREEASMSNGSGKGRSGKAAGSTPAASTSSSSTSAPISRVSSSTSLAKAAAGRAAPAAGTGAVAKSPQHAAPAAAAAAAAVRKSSAASSSVGATSEAAAAVAAAAKSLRGIQLQAAAAAGGAMSPSAAAAAASSSPSASKHSQQQQAAQVAAIQAAQAHLRQQHQQQQARTASPMARPPQGADMLTAGLPVPSSPSQRTGATVAAPADASAKPAAPVIVLQKHQPVTPPLPSPAVVAASGVASKASAAAVPAPQPAAAAPAPASSTSASSTSASVSPMKSPQRVAATTAAAATELLPVAPAPAPPVAVFDAVSVSQSGTPSPFPPGDYSNDASGVDADVDTDHGGGGDHPSATSPEYHLGGDKAGGAAKSKRKRVRNKGGKQAQGGLFPLPMQLLQVARTASGTSAAPTTANGASAGGGDGADVSIGGGGGATDESLGSIDGMTSSAAHWSNTSLDGSGGGLPSPGAVRRVDAAAGATTSTTSSSSPGVAGAGGAAAGGDMNGVYSSMAASLGMDPAAFSNLMHAMMEAQQAQQAQQQEGGDTGDDGAMLGGGANLGHTSSSGGGGGGGSTVRSAGGYLQPSMSSSRAPAAPTLSDFIQLPGLTHNGNGNGQQHNHHHHHHTRGRTASSASGSAAGTGSGVSSGPRTRNGSAATPFESMAAWSSGVMSGAGSTPRSPSPPPVPVTAVLRRPGGGRLSGGGGSLGIGSPTSPPPPPSHTGSFIVSRNGSNGNGNGASTTTPYRPSPAQPSSSSSSAIGMAGVFGSGGAGFSAFDSPHAHHHHLLVSPPSLPASPMDSQPASPMSAHGHGITRSGSSGQLALLASRRVALMPYYARCLAERRLTSVTEKLDESARLGDKPSLVALTMIAAGMDVAAALALSGVLPPQQGSGNDRHHHHDDGGDGSGAGFMAEAGYDVDITGHGGYSGNADDDFPGADDSGAATSDQLHFLQGVLAGLPTQASAAAHAVVPSLPTTITSSPPLNASSASSSLPMDGLDTAGSSGTSAGFDLGLDFPRQTMNRHAPAFVPGHSSSLPPSRSSSSLHLPLLSTALSAAQVHGGGGLVHGVNPGAREFAPTASASAVTSSAATWSTAAPSSSAATDLITLSNLAAGGLWATLGSSSSGTTTAGDLDSIIIPSPHSRQKQHQSLDLAPALAASSSAGLGGSSTSLPPPDVHLSGLAGVGRVESLGLGLGHLHRDNRDGNDADEVGDGNDVSTRRGRSLFLEGLGAKPSIPGRDHGHMLQDASETGSASGDADLSFDLAGIIDEM